MAPALRPALLALALLLGVPALGASQVVCNTGAKDRVDMTVSPAAVVHPSPGTVDFDRGWVQMLGSVQIDLAPQQPNKVWYLCLQSPSATQGVYGKPVGDLEYSLDALAWQPVSNTTLARLATGTGPRSVSVYYRVRLFWNRDVPGTYIADLQYLAAF